MLGNLDISETIIGFNADNIADFQRRVSSIADRKGQPSGSVIVQRQLAEFFSSCCGRRIGRNNLDLRTIVSAVGIDGLLRFEIRAEIPPRPTDSNRRN